MVGCVCKDVRWVGAGGSEKMPGLHLVKQMNWLLDLGSKNSCQMCDKKQ